MIEIVLTGEAEVFWKRMRERLPYKTDDEILLTLQRYVQAASKARNKIDSAINEWMVPV